jgi:DNA-3-methyladenine glycosylase
MFLAERAMAKPHATSRKAAKRKLTLSRAAPRATAAKIKRLARKNLPAGTEALARYLIGKTLVRETAAGRMAGRIVETEAYVPGDAAGHAFVGPTKRNRSLFLGRGHAYVYFSYGCWYLLNVSAEAEGVGAGVLLRAVEPVEGVALMRRRRGNVPLRDLARGPGRLGAAFGIDLSFDGVDLCGTGKLWLGAPVRAGGKIGVSVRIGISREAGRELRFFERGSPFVSGPRRISS